MKLLAQKLQLPGTTPGVLVPIEGPLSGVNPILGRPIESLGDIITAFLPLLFVLAGLILFIMFIWGGFDLLTSGGDPKKAESAKGKITNAIIGFIIVFIAFWLSQILSLIFGLTAF